MGSPGTSRRNRRARAKRGHEKKPALDPESGGPFNGLRLGLKTRSKMSPLCQTSGMNTILAALFLTMSPTSAHAAPAIPALAELEAAAENPSAAATALDGSSSAGPGLELVGEERGVLLRTRHSPARRVPHPGPGDVKGNYRNRNNRYVNIPAHTERVYGDIQTVRISDRNAYQLSSARKGMLIGAGIGLLGFLALLSGPVGWTVGAVTTIAGAIIGSNIGHNEAAAKPDVFQRAVNKRREITYP